MGNLTTRVRISGAALLRHSRHRSLTNRPGVRVCGEICYVSKSVICIVGLECDQLCVGLPSNGCSGGQSTV